MDTLLTQAEAYRFDGTIAHEGKTSAMKFSGLLIKLKFLRFANNDNDDNLSVRSMFQARVDRKKASLKSGYTQSSQLSVRVSEDGLSYTVFDGNHRLAAMKQLCAENDPTNGTCYHYTEDFEVPCVVYKHTMPVKLCTEYAQVVNTLQSFTAEDGTPVDFLRFLQNALTRTPGQTAAAIYSGIEQVFNHMGTHKPSRINNDYVTNALSFLRAMGDEGLVEAERLMDIEPNALFDTLRDCDYLELPKDTVFNKMSRYCFLPNSAWLFKEASKFTKATTNSKGLIPPHYLAIVWLRAMWAGWVTSGGHSTQRNQAAAMRDEIISSAENWVVSQTTRASIVKPQEQSRAGQASSSGAKPWETIIKAFKVLQQTSETSKTQEALAPKNWPITLELLRNEHVPEADAIWLRSTLMRRDAKPVCTPTIPDAIRNASTIPAAQRHMYDWALLDHMLEPPEIVDPAHWKSTASFRAQVQCVLAAGLVLVPQGPKWVAYLPTEKSIAVLAKLNNFWQSSALGQPDKADAAAGLLESGETFLGVETDLSKACEALRKADEKAAYYRNKKVLLTKLQQQAKAEYDAAKKKREEKRASERPIAQQEAKEEFYAHYDDLLKTQTQWFEEVSARDTASKFKEWGLVTCGTQVLQEGSGSRIQDCTIWKSAQLGLMCTIVDVRHQLKLEGESLAFILRDLTKSGDSDHSVAVLCSPSQLMTVYTILHASKFNALEDRPYIMGPSTDAFTLDDKVHAHPDPVG